MTDTAILAAFERYLVALADGGGLSFNALGRAYGVGGDAVRDIILGRAWKE